MFTENKMLDYKELKEAYPKTMSKLMGWVKRNLENFQKTMISQVGSSIGDDVEIPKITDEHAEAATGAILTSYSKTLYDFLDENKIFLTVDYIFEEGFVVAFAGYKSVEGHLNRIEAEMVGFKAAFAKMEEEI